MSQKESTFAYKDQTVMQQLAGTLLTVDQKQFIKNQLSVIAEERLALVPDPNNYASFIQTEAHLKGQMDAYKYLLDCSVVSEREILEAAREEANQSQ